MPLSFALGRQSRQRQAEAGRGRQRQAALYEFETSLAYCNFRPARVT